MRIDHYLPNYDFNEVHRVTVNASFQVTFLALKELLPSELSPLVFLMLNLRELPAIISSKAKRFIMEEKPFLNQLYEGGFIPIEETQDEIVFGLIGQFWKLTGGEQSSGVTDTQGFLEFNQTDFAKVAANLYVQAIDGKTQLSTETRIWAPDPETLKKFAIYWRLISFGSGWIRILWLKAIQRRAERLNKT